jgi:hydroxyethylthiazole kinase-like uncharacterized protein yjeF
VSSAATTRVASRCAKRAKAAVFDAGALDAATPGPNVMTPHFGEMAELCDCSREAVERAPGPIALEVAKSRDCIVALKGGCTFIASPDEELWIYRGGSIGLGTSGSGDVLAGVIAGLIAQGAAAPQAAVWGVVLHGEAGAALSKANGRVGFLAREIADQIPRLRARLDRPASR